MEDVFNKVPMGSQFPMLAYVFVQYLVPQDVIYYKGVVPVPFTWCHSMYDVWHDVVMPVPSSDVPLPGATL